MNKNWVLFFFLNTDNVYFLRLCPVLVLIVVFFVIAVSILFLLHILLYQSRILFFFNLN